MRIMWGSCPRHFGVVVSAKGSGVTRGFGRGAGGAGTGWRGTMGLGERKEKRGHGGGQKQSYELDTKGRSIDRMFLKECRFIVNQERLRDG